MKNTPTKKIPSISAKVLVPEHLPATPGMNPTYNDQLTAAEIVAHLSDHLQEAIIRSIKKYRRQGIEEDRKDWEIIEIYSLEDEQWIDEIKFSKEINTP